MGGACGRAWWESVQVRINIQFNAVTTRHLRDMPKVKVQCESIYKDLAFTGFVLAALGSTNGALWQQALESGHYVVLAVARGSSEKYFYSSYRHL